MNSDATHRKALSFSIEVTTAWLNNPNTRIKLEDIPTALKTVFDGINALSIEPPLERAARETRNVAGAVSEEESLASVHYIISMIDGKPYRNLRRHLSKNGLTPEAYRERYKLRPDYPIVAPSYSEVRRQIALSTGLGGKGWIDRAGAKAVSPKPVAKRRTPHAEGGYDGHDRFRLIAIIE